MKAVSLRVSVDGTLPAAAAAFLDAAVVQANLAAAIALPGAVWVSYVNNASGIDAAQNAVSLRITTDGLIADAAAVNLDACVAQVQSAQAAAPGAVWLSYVDNSPAPPDE